MRSAGHKLPSAWDPNAFSLHFEIHVRPARPIILAALQIDSRLIFTWISVPISCENIIERDSRGVISKKRMQPRRASNANQQKKNEKPATDRPNLSYHIRYWDGDSYRYPIHWNGMIVNRKAKGIKRDDTNRSALRNETNNLLQVWENLAKSRIKILKVQRLWSSINPYLYCPIHYHARQIKNVIK